MKKITLLFLLFYSIASFAQEPLMLDIDRIFPDTGNAYVLITTNSNATLYQQFGAISNYGQIFSVTAASFPLKIVWQPGYARSGCQPITRTYTYEQYTNGETFTGGCAPEYFYLRSPHVRKTPIEIGVCETINFQPGTQPVYSLDGVSNWQPVVGDNFNLTAKLGKDFRGYVRFRYNLDSRYANPKVTMVSKPITYNVFGCAPKIDTSVPPVAKGESCNGMDDGEVTFTFDRALEAAFNERFLFTYSPVGVNIPVSISSDKPGVEMVSPLKYKIKGIKVGTYTFRYQTVKETAPSDNPDPTKYVDGPDFAIAVATKLTSNATPIHPKCNGKKGGIQITADGGTGAHFYNLNGETEVVNGATVLKKYPLSSLTGKEFNSGNYRVIVLDANNCQSAPQDIEIFQPPTAITISGSVNNVTAPGAKNGKIILDVPLAGTPAYTLVCTNGSETIPIDQLGALAPGTYVVTSQNALTCDNVSKTFLVREEINYDVTSANLSCFGANDGSITLNIKGGSGNYTVTWQDPSNNPYSPSASTSSNNGIVKYTATGFSPGNFKFNIKDNEVPSSGTISAPLTVQSNNRTISGPQSALLVAEPTINQPAPGNTNGSISINPTKGYGNYNYIWTKDGTVFSVPLPQSPNNPRGLGDGTYYVKITDKSTIDPNETDCSITKGPYVLKALNVSISTPTAISCQGGTTNLTAQASGGNGVIKFKWIELIGSLPFVEKEFQGQESSSLTGIKAGNYKVIVTDGDNNTTSFTIYVPDSTNPNITAATSQTPVKCFNGSDGKANIKITNAPANSTYTFRWYKGTSPETLIELTDNIISAQTESTKSGLTAGNYTVTASNSFCQESFSVTVAPATPIIIQEVAGGFKDLKCFGDKNGSIAINVTGGKTPYTYIWKKGTSAIAVNNNLNPTLLEAGIYSVEIRDDNYDSSNPNQCISILENIVISSPNKLEFSYTTTDVTCKSSGDGSIQLNITGGTFKKDTNNKPIYKISCGPPILGTIIDIPNQNIKGLKAGKCTVTVSDDNNCVIATQEIEIKEPALPLAFGTETIVNATGNSLLNGNIKLTNTGGWGNYSYKWYIGEIVDESKLIANENSNLLKDRPAGKYIAVVIDKNKDNLGCAITSAIFEIKEPAVLTLDVTATNTKCNGGQGSIIAVAKGGAEIAQQQSDRQYTYELFLNNVFKEKQIGNSANFTGLPIGQYKITATDSKANVSTIATTSYKNGTIITTGYVELKQPDPILITETSAVKKVLTCFGDQDGKLSVSVSGGTPFTVGAPYHYVWKKLNLLNLIYEPIGTDNPTQINLFYGKYSVEVRDANYDATNPSSCIGILENIIIAQPDQLQFTFTKADVSCYGGNNGTAKLTITGGTKPYTIICNGGTIENQNSTVSGLSEGTYIVRVVDGNSCQTTEQTVIIKQPSASLHISNQVVTPTTGFGLATGKITITATGGTGTYSYEWKNSSGATVGTNSSTLSNVIAGTYTVLVTDLNGCHDSKSYDVYQPTKPILSETHLQSKCNGLLGSLNAIATGGATYNQNQSDRTYSYKLKNKANGVTITKNGNVANFNDIADGDYSLTATDISGIESNTIDVKFTQPTPIVVKLTSRSNVNCFGDQDGTIAISVSGGTPLLVNGNPEYTYQWKRKNTATNTYENFIPTSLNALFAGTYAVEVRDANYNSGNAAYCIGVLENIEITQPADFGFDIDKITYTNPSANNGNDGKLHFEITGGKSNYEYKFYTKDASGNETILNTVANSAVKTVDFTGLIKDHYYISAKDDTGCIKYADFDFTDNPLTLSINQTQLVTCYEANNGVLNINANGGFGIKTISWYLDNTLLSTAILTTENLNLVNAKPGRYYAIIKDSKKVEVTSNTINITQPDLVTFSMSQEPVKCIGDSNGKITLTAAGGNGNFSYRYFYKGVLIKDWQNFSSGVKTTISDLAEGEYTIYVQDSQQCKSTGAAIQVTSPTALSISNTISLPATGKGLSNGSIAITVQGANGNYTYQWFKNDNTNINQITNTAENLSAGKYYVIITDAKGCNLTSPLLEVTEPPLLETSIAVQNVILCRDDKNGSLKPTTIGGFLKPGENYTYKWYANGAVNVLATSTILNNIGKGSYYVTATDSNGNEAKSTTLIVTEPAILDNILTSDYTLCGDSNDWTINATPSGGTAPYYYMWNTGAKTGSIQNVPPSDYSVLVTDSHGCTITKSVTITAPIHLAAAEKIVIPTCYEGSDATIEVTSSGGKAPYTYLWNTGEKSNILSGAAAGDYSVTITDSKGCVINHNYKIENPPKDVINLGEDVTLCFDQTLTINATIDDDKATYFWKSDKGFTSNKAMITVSEPANYTVIVTNKLGCQATDTIKISSQNTAISAEFAVSSQVFKNEKIVIVDISNPIADEIEWVLPPNATVISKNKDFAEISFSKTGQYDITLNTKKGNCTAFQTKQIIVTEGEYEENDPDDTTVQKKFDVKIYPNPSNGVFTVDVLLNKVMPAHVKVYNLNNNLLIDSKTQDGKDNYLFNFSLSGLPSGIYFVLFESQQGNKLRKIIIQ
ncbi:T9SS type A sorting domain-containing protein [Flavobacterium piscisymbiosum]|uniref:T9SS type A sorting domain-containing protein n=1 Tax=Flavobacterium piscisymbiosum TaxID=2893753 RepID=A0ABS8MDR7_9FLAO|nr:T9SS type A sorting domain-containing protein [Flavobacterium sp. F-30]MCC9063563.1 T9SS type A sorting domain-containing protein [Flavobacterium sp. F-30]